MKTALRHPATGRHRLCRWSRSTGSPDDSSDDSPDDSSDRPTGRRVFLAIPLLIPLIIPLIIPRRTAFFTPLIAPPRQAMRGPAPGDRHPVERAGWILDASDR
jgi:hypothetical protein